MIFLKPGQGIRVVLVFWVKLCLGSLLHSECVKQTNRLAEECGLEGQAQRFSLVGRVGIVRG